MFIEYPRWQALQFLGFELSPLYVLRDVVRAKARQSSKNQAPESACDAAREIQQTRSAHATTSGSGRLEKAGIQA
jgi:hypothetical protein